MRSQPVRPWAAIAAGVAGALLVACGAPTPGGPTASYPAPQLSAYPVVGAPPTAVPGQSPQPPAAAPQPEPGLAAISGLLYSTTQQRGVPETPFYLSPGVGEGNRFIVDVIGDPIPARGDVLAVTDAAGVFSLNNIPPGNYFLLTWAPYNWYPAYRSLSERVPLFLELSADQAVALGTLYVEWP